MKEEVADPECRKVAAGAYTTLMRVGGEGKSLAPRPADTAEYKALLKEKLGAKVDSLDATTYEYVATRLASIVNHRHWAVEDWESVAVPFLAPVCGEAAVKEAVKKLADKAQDEYEKAAIALTEEEEEGEDLCNCEFSLAYGAKILLNNARLRLKRGKRYGLCGPNGSGKTTLMRAIVNGQVEGFPPPTELKTVYVEHDIDGSVADLVPVEFIFTDPTFAGIPKVCAGQLVG